MKIETILDHQTIFGNRRPDVFFAVRFQAHQLPAPELPDAAYCIAIDQSASIDEDAFQLIRRFVTQFIRHLPAKALLSLVTFHESADALFDLANIGDKSALQAVVNNLAPIECGTNLSAALLLAREQLHHAPAHITTKRIILLTDGEHTAGIRDEDFLEQIALDGSSQRIFISTLHLGPANADLMSRISTHGHATLRGKNLLDLIARELGALQPIAAQNVRLRLKPLDFCERIHPLGFAFNEASDRWLTCALGDMLSDEERTFCFNLTIPLLPCIDDQPCASLANETLLELEAGYEEISADTVTSKIFATTVRIPALSKTAYPPSEDGSLQLRDGA